MSIFERIIPRGLLGSGPMGNGDEKPSGPPDHVEHLVEDITDIEHRGECDPEGAKRTLVEEVPPHGDWTRVSDWFDVNGTAKDTPPERSGCKAYSKIKRTLHRKCQKQICNKAVGWITEGDPYSCDKDKEKTIKYELSGGVTYGIWTTADRDLAWDQQSYQSA